VSDALAGTSGRPTSEPAGSDDLGMQPKVRVDIEEVLDDPNVRCMGPIECISNSPDPQSPTRARALEVAVADEVAAILSDVPSAQPERSMASEQSSQPAVLTPRDFRVVVEWSVPVRLQLHHGFRCQHRQNLHSTFRRCQ